MLKPAIYYSSEVGNAFRSIWFEPKYYYYNCGCFYEDFEPSSDSIENHQFVSVDKWGNVIGYVGYSVDRTANVAYDLNIINFDNKLTVFALDIVQAIDDIFNKYKFSKIEFSVVIGNPAEAMYDTFIKACKGRIVGTYRDHIKLVDGTICDVKMYELMRDEYCKNKDKFYTYRRK